MSAVRDTLKLQSVTRANQSSLTLSSRIMNTVQRFLVALTELGRVAQGVGTAVALCVLPISHVPIALFIGCIHIFLL